MRSPIEHDDDVKDGSVELAVKLMRTILDEVPNPDQRMDRIASALVFILAIIFSAAPTEEDRRRFRAEVNKALSAYEDSDDMHTMMDKVRAGLKPGQFHA